MGLRIRTLDGRETTLPNDIIDELRASLRGRLLTADSADYNEARAIWNAMIDRRPALIARCLTAADVATAVRFARENSLLTSVRGGGHNIAGNAVIDGGLTIDLSAMRGVQIDAERRVARAGAWPRHAARHQLDDGRRRTHPRRRLRLAQPPLRPVERQPHCRRRRHRLGRACSRERRRER
jgi:hypothetical protein